MKNISVLRANVWGIQIKFTHEKKRYIFAPVKNGRFDNQIDYARANGIAHQISIDLATGEFDKTLRKYKPISDEEIAVIEKKQNLTFSDLWSQYAKAREKQVAHATFLKTYGGVTATMQKCPAFEIKDALKLQRWMIDNKTPLMAKRNLMQLNAACKWGVNHELINSNPLEKYASNFNKKTSTVGEEIDPFTAKERDAIIQAFSSHAKWNYYRGLIEFLFFVGCRPSEALALTWDDVTGNQILFDKVFTHGKLCNGLKSESKRTIRQNQKMKDILAEQKQHLKVYRITDTRLIFPTPKNHDYIDWAYFSQKVWKDVLSKIEGLRYRPPYQMRHTFITLALKQVSIQDVAKHCGNTPALILKHYAGHTRDFEMPEI